MTLPEGGYFDRCVEYSAFTWVHDGLEARRWFLPGVDQAGGVRQHKTVRMLPRPWDEKDANGMPAPIPPNLLVMEVDSITDDEFELGSNATERTYTGYVEFYADDTSIGRHLSGDVHNMLLGKMASIGRGHPTIPIVDPGEATPEQITYAEVTGVNTERGTVTSRVWNGLLYSTQFQLVVAVD